MIGRLALFVVAVAAPAGALEPTGALLRRLATTTSTSTSTSSTTTTSTSTSIPTTSSTTTSTSTSIPTTSSTTTSTSTSVPTTSSTSTSTSSTTTAVPPTTLLDGDGIYQAGDNLLGTAQRYYGGSPTVGGTVQATNDNFWITGRAITRMSGVVRLTNAPGAGKSWAVYIEHMEVPLPSTSSCADAVGSLVQVPIASITDTNKAANFNVDLTSTNGFVGIPAGSCFHVVFVPVSSPASAAGGYVSLLPSDTTGDGLLTLTGAATTSAATEKYLGSLLTTASDTIGAWWSVPRTLSACTGAIAMNVAPGAGKSWAVKLQTSMAPKDATHSCEDFNLTSQVTTVAGCTVSDTNKSCRIPLTAITAPTGYCLNIDLLPVATPTATTSVTWSLECTLDTVEPATRGATAFFGQSNSNLPTSDWYAGTSNATLSTATGPIYWTNGSKTLTKCSGAIESETAGTGPGQYDFTLRYTTAGLVTGFPPSLGTVTCAQSASPPTFTEVALCSEPFGTNVFCGFTDVTVNIPPYACVQLHATLTGGTPAGVKTRGEWLIECRQ